MVCLPSQLCFRTGIDRFTRRTRFDVCIALCVPAVGNHSRAFTARVRQSVWPCFQDQATVVQHELHSKLNDFPRYPVTVNMYNFTFHTKTTWYNMTVYICQDNMYNELSSERLFAWEGRWRTGSCDVTKNSGYLERLPPVQSSVVVENHRVPRL